MDKIKKVAIYCRLSQEDKNKYNDNEDSLSIQNQKELLLSYILKQGWELYNIYLDDDYSGMDSTRPAFKKMLQAAKEQKFDIVLCKSQSRFTRDMEIAERYINYKFKLWGIRFISLADSVDTAVIGNKKHRQITGLVNEWYVEDTSENIKIILNEKRKKGYYIGATAIFGYIKDPNNKGKIIPDKMAKNIIKRIFNLYESGYTTYKIAQILNDGQILPPAKYKKLYINNKYNHVNIKSCKWTDSTIRNILRNEIYTGNMVQGKTIKLDIKSKKTSPVEKNKWIIVKDTHEAIISTIQFNNVQRIMAKNRRVISSKGIRHPFSGKVICAKCKGVTRKRVAGNGDIYFRCKNSIPPNRTCSNLYRIQLSTLMYIVKDKIEEILYEYIDFEKIEDYINQRLINKDKNNDIDTRKKIELKLEKQKEMLIKIYEDRFSNEITFEEFKILKTNVAMRIKDFEIELKKSNYNKSLLDSNSIKNIIIDYKSLNNITYEMIDALIENIEINKISNELNKVQEIKIYWKI